MVNYYKIIISYHKYKVKESNKIVFYSAHTLAGSSTTFRNRLAANPRLSKGALQAIRRQAIENSYNHLGEKKTIEFDILWTTDDPEDVDVAQEYLKSSASPEALNAGVVNVYKGKYRHVELPRVAISAVGAVDTDKRHYWGIASSATSCFYLGIWETPHMLPPAEGSNAEDVQTDDWDYRNRAGFGIVIPGASWIHFSSGDGAA